MLKQLDKNTFKLSDSFIKEFKGKQPKWGPLGYFVYKRTYARKLDDKRTEEFWQTIQRVVETVYTVQKAHCDNLHLPWNQNKAQHSAQEMYRRMWEFKFLPPGRGLWAMDIDLLKAKGGAALNNCCFVSTNQLTTGFSDPFTFTMDMLMLGVGVGADITGAETVTIRKPRETDVPFVVEDSREGWVMLIQTVLDSYVGKTEFPLHIDISGVRKEGEPIKTFGGLSSGPEPLLSLVKDIKKVLEAHELPHKISSSEIVDLFNVIGKCVVSGNVRRSAELMLGEPTDTEFRKLKQDKLALMSHRWASNNSVSCKIGMDYADLAKDTIVNGEPGYIWLDNARAYGRIKDGITNDDCGVMGFNPCGEQSLESFELCCLVETFPSNHETYEDYERTLKYAYLYGKTVTLIGTHDERANAVMMRNRRIGTSMSGIIRAFNKFGKRKFFEWCDSGYKYIQKLDKIYSNWLCVPLSKKTTTVKPSGTISNLPGVPPGIHYPHSEYHIRNIRVSKDSHLVEICRAAGYPIEPDKYSKTSVVISFPVHEEYFKRGKDDVSMWEQLENAAQMQYFWSDNAVSITVTFKPAEANSIAEALSLYETRLKTVSFLPLEDHGYEQAPFITIDAKHYERLISKIKPLKINENEHESQEKFCDGEVCEITVVKS